MNRWMAIAGVCLSMATGCAVHGLQDDDQDRVRHTLLDLYTNQIMDNLIRQYNGLPIVQLDYEYATGQLTLKDNQVAVRATPVTMSDDVHNAYREFLALPGSLEATREPPPPDAHLCKKCGRLYYWVPAEYKMAFLRLALAATAQRGQPLGAPDAFYTVNIIDVLRKEPSDVKGTDPLKRFNLIVKLDSKLPVDRGRIEIAAAAGAIPSSSRNNKGSASSPLSAASSPTTRFAGGAAGVAAALAGPTQAAHNDGSKKTTFFIEVRPSDSGATQQTDQIAIDFDSAKAMADFLTVAEMRDMLPITARIFLDRHRPVPPTGSAAQNRIESQLQQIQFNQSRSNP